MWSFVLTALDGTSKGEIVNASNRSVSFPLNRMVTGGFSVPLDHRHADFLLAADALVKVYETVGRLSSGALDRRLRAVGEVISAEEVVGEDGKGSVAVTFGDGMFRLLARLVGKSPSGYTNGTALVPVDRGVIAWDMIARVQALFGAQVDAGGDAGIRQGTIGASSTTYLGPIFYAPVGEQIASLSVALDGFDFELTPREPEVDASGVALWNFNVWAAKGQPRPNAIFEYGTGKKNVKGYRRPVTKDALLNDGFSLPPGFPDNATQAVLRTSDATSITARGRFERTVPGDSVADLLRQKLLDEHVRIRKVARQVISFDPHANAPRLGTDFDVGDLVTFRVARGGKIRVNAYFRVYGVDVNIDANGTAKYTINVVPS